MKFLTFPLILFTIFMSVLEISCRPTGVLKDLIRNNVAGPAVNFQTIPWPIDPDAGLRRRKEYEAVNGRFGYKHIERLGLGEDGRTEERRLQQRLRDETVADVANTSCDRKVTHQLHIYLQGSKPDFEY